MGGCFSSQTDCSTSSNHQKQCANLVTLAGELRQYPIPATVSQVLDYEGCSPDSFFVCSSDGLDFDDFIPSLDLDAELEPAQIYFLLPASKLKHRLVASDMAALVVKADIALNAANSSRRRTSKARISPVLVNVEDQSSNQPITVNVEKASKGSTAGNSRSRSTRKLHRFASRRSKLARLSFKMRLTTINEGTVLLD
ncbi:uncharacterized protein LOC127248248 [Andrographis paniculata]|uniref:uncharacterized protein LOC127248248 n=1 Tax=Andrographis paniculata TaxID=175694 RepID=UPI0021E89B6E|nr:uncharacterized protein LOC127248248 [Andrographis paniculata]